MKGCRITFGVAGTGSRVVFVAAEKTVLRLVCRSRRQQGGPRPHSFQKRCWAGLAFGGPLLLQLVFDLLQLCECSKSL
jgi:hypothetical protein